MRVYVVSFINALAERRHSARARFALLLPLSLLLLLSRTARHVVIQPETRVHIT